MILKDMIIRELRKDDTKPVVDLLQNLSLFQPVDLNYNEIWLKFAQQPNVHAVVADLYGEIIGYGSVVIEFKIRGDKVAHIEDIVCDPSFRKMNVGSTIMNYMFDFAQKQGCYKLTLHCSQENSNFYERCSYHINGVSMKRFIT